MNFYSTQSRLAPQLMPIFVFMIAAIFPSASVFGATTEAWAAHRQEVIAACAAASELRNPKPAGSTVEFDDRVGLTAVIIDGYYKQPSMKNKRGRLLCLFDKRTRAASVSDAESIVSKRRP